MGDLHLISRYKNKPEFAVYVKIIIALAFVPIPDLDYALYFLMENVFTELLNLIDWFEDFLYWSENRNRGSRRTERFPPAMWNLYERVLTQKYQTNNYAEAANIRLTNQISNNHPKI